MKAGKVCPDVALWNTRAERLLELALSELRSGRDAIPEAAAAVAAMRIADGELPASELDFYPFPGEDTGEPTCTCPPEMSARGGWTSTCPAHRTLMI